jgi:para-nitrobenzyl esterase
MSEDCLALNLWTPSLHGPAKRPVMVWLHSGFHSGSSGIPLYDGTNLAAKHDVVVVGLNHRLNAFGYLYLGDIGGEKFADSGNAGMLDIVLALQWVRDNISQFGGDPSNVTVFGESGGGGKVGVLMLMPPAQGLFHKAIVESSPGVRLASREEASATAKRFLSEARVSQHHLDDLYKIPMDHLIAAVHSIREPRPIEWVPVVDGRSLPIRNFAPDRRSSTASISMLIGTNETETTLYILDEAEPTFSVDAEADMRMRLALTLRNADASKLDQLVATYRKNRPKASPRDIRTAIETDYLFRRHAIAQAERKAAQFAAPVFMYIFSWQTPVMDGRLKATHMLELPFVFDNADKAPGWVGTGPELQPLADKISSAWAAFARNGNPNHPGLPQWPAFESETRATMVFNNECKVVNDPGKDERLVMNTLPPSW